MNHGGLFDGMGGFDLAAEWMGWNNVFHCEINPFCQKILKYYWPNAKSYEDITKTDFTIHRGRIDILTGGFPCQPYSVAGKQLGTEDSRHLWPEMLRAIREIQPTWIIGENVPGLINWNDGLVFEQVQAELEAEGYEVQPFLLPAAGVGAPHKRERIWFVAYSSSKQSALSVQQRKQGQKDFDINWQNEGGTSTNSNSLTFDILTDKGSNRETIEQRRQEQETGKLNGSNYFTRNVTNTYCKGFQRSSCHWGQNFSIREKIKIRETTSKCNSGLIWERFPTQSPVCDGNDGIPYRLDSITFPKWRTESIKAGGNAIVPQVALQIFKAIEQYNNLILTQ